MSDRRPNVFSYATKELSQDAMICWLIAWSAVEPEDYEEWHLRACGDAFVRALLRKHGQELAGPIRRASIHQQDHGIDVLALVEDQKQRHVLLIEDKTDTGERDNQLQQYRDRVTNGETKVGKQGENWDLLHPLYLKTGNQSLANDQKIEESECYKVFRRDEFLDVLGTYPGNNPVLTDFRQHLKDREAQFRSFRHWRKEREGEWSWAGWEGFFVACEGEGRLRGPGWHYVARPDGGFLAFPWGWSDLEGGKKAFLQLEVSPGGWRKLCAKIGFWDCRGSGDRKGVAEFWSRVVLAVGRGRLERPNRIRTGDSTTVAEWRDEWMAFDERATVDVGGTVSTLEDAQSCLEQAVELKTILEIACQQVSPKDAEKRLDCNFGRFGFQVRGTWNARGWNPGVFVGVLLDGADHGVDLLDPERGDACVMLCLHETLHSATWAEQGCRELAQNLESRLPEGWTVSDHWNGNRWHPVHVRCPLEMLFKDAPDPCDKARQFQEAAGKVVSAVLAYLPVREPWE